MRAVLLNAPGGAGENMIVAEAPDVEPRHGEVVVAVEYAGCNFADTMMRRGVYPHPKGYPLVAGLEVAGTVTAVGPGVAEVKIGDRVAGFSEDGGGFAEFCVLSVRRLFALPDTIDSDVAAAFLLQGLTAWHLLHTVSTTNRGDTLLIHAIGGGVGLYLTQFAKKAGALVIGTVGTAGKEKRALEFGADKVINRSDEDFVAAVMEFTGGKGVDKIVDSTGGTILDRSFATIRPLGHVVSYGEAEAKPQSNLWEQLVRKSLTFTRMHLGHIDDRSEAWRTALREVLAMVESGELEVPIEEVFPLARVHDMYDRLESRQVAGKLLLKVSA
jgi:NADPH2:quinone reductase